MSWSAAPEAPARKYGPSWTTTHTAPAYTKPSGWFALIEKVAPHTGVGNLSAIPSPYYRTSASLGGTGTLSAGVTVVKSLGAAFSTSGALTSEATRVEVISCFFTGGGRLEQPIPFDDGLTAGIAVSYAARFSGGGEFLAGTVGGISYPDGLSAILFPRYGTSAALSGGGQLVAFVGGVAVALAGLNGSGALSALISQKYSLPASLGGAGALSATVVPQLPAVLTGSGSLSATVLRSHPMPAALAGSGSLSATVVPQLPAALAGSGSLSATVSPWLIGSMSGAGSLTATAEEYIGITSPIDGGSAALTGTTVIDGGDAAGTGVLVIDGGDAGAPSGPEHLTGVTYSQSSVYSEDVAATYAGMNNGDASGASGETGTDADAAPYIMADLGSSKYIDHIVIGYDYLADLPTGWGTGYCSNQGVQTSDDASTWTSHGVTPDYAAAGSPADGMVTIPIGVTARYVALREPAYGYCLATEFQVWGN